MWQILPHRPTRHGSDTSIIHKNDLPIYFKIEKPRVNLKSASGNDINIIDRVMDFPIEIGQYKMVFNPYITEDHPQYTIIGIRSSRSTRSV